MFKILDGWMKPLGFFTALIVILTMVTLGYAQEKSWTDEAELSFVDTGGNTEIRTLSAQNLLKYKFTEKLQGAWKIGALYGESDGEKNAESYFTELRTDYLFTELFYSFALGGFLRDEFAGIDSRYYVGPGIGYKFLIGPKHHLVGEAGVNWVKEEYTDHTDEAYVQGRAFAQYEYAFTDKNRFSQSLEYLYDFEDSDNYNLNSETALISALSDYLSLKASYVVKYDNEPVPETLEDTDTILGITLIVSF